MPKPILRPTQSNQSASILSATPKKVQATQMEKMNLDRLLAKPRSKKYIEAIHKLDVGGHTNNQNQVNEIINAIRNEFPEVELGGVLLGLVSKCYLGGLYEVHTLSVMGNFIEHYEVGHTLPEGMEKARSIAMRGGYEVIEVYSDCYRAISSDGTVAYISN